MDKMKLHRKCKKCGEFFQVEPMEIKFLCNKEGCQQRHYITPEMLLEKIKRVRGIPMDYFNLYDLDKPIYYGKKKQYIDYERVCRICGKPLRNKDGKYSKHRRYCSEHNGYSLWIKYNWGMVSKGYAEKVRDQKCNKPIISKQFIEKLQNHTVKSHYKEKPRRIRRDLKNLTICEECKKICSIYTDYWHSYSLLKLEVINIHHKIPIHTLTEENLHLIWDYSNLMALCSECHNKQDHQLKNIDRLNFQKITNFI